MFDGTVGQLQPMLEIQTRAIARCSVDLLLHHAAIVRVHSR